MFCAIATDGLPAESLRLKLHAETGVINLTDTATVPSKFEVGVRMKLPLPVTAIPATFELLPDHVPFCLSSAGVPPIDTVRLPAVDAEITMLTR